LRILITGVSGFIGQALSKRFADGHEVHGVYESPESKAKNPEIVKGHKHLADLTDHAAIEELIQFVQPHIVIHLAAKSEVAFSFDNYLQVSEVNYVGTVNLAEANRKHNPNLELFCMASTMETYGHHAREGGPFTEDTPQYPMAPYAVAKLACEKYLGYMDYAYGFPSVILRQTNAYGRTDNAFFIVERIISQMLASDVCKLGDPDPYRNFLFIDDLVDLYELLLAEPTKVRGQTFVTGPPNALTIRDLADLIREKLDWGGEIEWNTQPPRPGEIYYLESDGAKLKQHLGWEAKTSLSAGLDQTIEVWRTHPSAS
jgi:GDP-4-dehydro-6-deoxy-D-mannose reductase